MRSQAIKLAFLIALLPVLGCQSEAELEAEKQQGMTEVNASIEEAKRDLADEKALVPQWYRKGWRVEVWFNNGSPAAKAIGWWKVADLHRSILIAGVFIYAFYGFLVHIALNRDSYGHDYEAAGVLFFFGALLGPELLAIPLHYLIGIALNVATGEPQYVPCGFIAFCIHVILMLTPVFLIGPYLFAKMRQSGTARHETVPSPIVSGGHVRWKRIGRAALKAFIVAIATAIGTKFGGIIGGALAAVVAAVIGLSVDQGGSSGSSST